MASYRSERVQNHFGPERDGPEQRYGLLLTRTHRLTVDHQYCPSVVRMSTTFLGLLGICTKVIWLTYGRHSKVLNIISFLCRILILVGACAGRRLGASGRGSPALCWSARSGVYGVPQLRRLGGNLRRDSVHGGCGGTTAFQNIPIHTPGARTPLTRYVIDTLARYT